MLKSLRSATVPGLIVVSLFSTLHCSSKQVSSTDELYTASSERNPSSEPEALGNEDEEAFQLMFSKERVDQSLFLKLSQIEEVFYRAHTLTAKFDALLAKTSKQTQGDQQAFLKKATTAGIYPKLQALQQIGEETNARLSYFVRRIIEISKDANTDAETKAKADGALKYLANYLAQSPLSLRLALSPWTQSLSDEFPGLKGFEKAFTRLYVGNYEGLLTLSKEPKVKKHLEYMSKRVSNKPGYLLRRMEELAKTLTPDLLANLEEERAPQSKPTLNKSKKLAKGHYTFVFEGPAQKTGTDQLLTELSARKTPGAFFLPSVSANEALLRKIQGMGMTVGNGTKTRPELPKTFNDELVSEIENSGKNTPLIVLPFGAGMNSTRVQGVIQKNKLQIVATQIPSFSWADWDASRVADRVSQQMQMSKSGNVILNPSVVSARVSAALIEKQSEEMRFVDIKEVLGE